MALSNRERQALYRQRLKDAAQPAWIRKDFDVVDDARSTINWFREFFQSSPIPAGGELQVFNRTLSEGGMALLVRMPWPLGEADADMMKGWRLAREDAEDLGFWRRQV